MKWAIPFPFALAVCFLRSASACGTVTHIEISYRALYNYYDTYDDLSYDTIVRQNQDALEAGSAFPDAFYPDICFNGKYHDISEDTHWTPFVNASINYINKKYPKPWDMSVQRLVSFVMGVVSHQVADVSWHSLGIDQGFLQGMARTNYHGNYGAAHTDGDLGGEVLNLYQLNLSYSNVIGEWYIPVDDLLSIYRDLYGRERIDENVIVTCTKLAYLTKVAERLAVKKYYPISAKNSPYLVDELYSYFLGGIEDMAVWTQRIWRHFTFAMENGQKRCDMAFNPIFIQCNDTTSVKPFKKTSSPLRNGFYTKADLSGSSLDDVIVKKTGRGVTLLPSGQLKAMVTKALENASEFRLREQQNDKNRSKKDKEITAGKPYELPKAVFTVGSDYAKLGIAYAVADLNNDGNEDVVIGCPGFYSPSHQQSGMVFILFGTDEGLNTSTTDIYQAAQVKIPGPEDPHGAHSQFGSALAILDFDKDGKLDIAVGAPSYGSVNLTYTGKVFLYSPVDKLHYNLRGAVTCKEVYCNVGSILASGDVNSDLFSDLILGSPFAPGKGEQRGMTGIIHADSKYAGKINLDLQLSTNEFNMFGTQNYSWFGNSIAVKKFEDRKETYVVIGEPGLRKCARANCSYDANDTQAVGQIHLLYANGGSLLPGRQIPGWQEFQMFGHQVDMGRPFGPYTDIIAVAATGQDVVGRVSHVPAPFEQVGSVFLYNFTNPYQYPITVFNGDRRFGRFGAQVKFSDLNRDGYDDLIIGAPLRTNDFTGQLRGAQEGKVYVFMGGPDFPRGDATTKCGLLHPVEPCPGEKASRVLAFDETFARFGAQVAVVHCRNKVNVLATAEHSSMSGRLAGAIGLFEF